MSKFEFDFFKLYEKNYHIIIILVKPQHIVLYDIDII